jgi:hypothetical protein
MIKKSWESAFDGDACVTYIVTSKKECREIKRLYKGTGTHISIVVRGGRVEVYGSYTGKRHGVELR